MLLNVLVLLVMFVFGLLCSNLEEHFHFGVFTFTVGGGLMFGFVCDCVDS